MVQPAEHWRRYDLARIRADHAWRWDRDALTKALMGTASVEVPDSELTKKAVQVTLPQDDYVIEAFLARATEKPLDHRIHQRGAHRRLDDPNARPLRHAIELGTVLVVPIADDELRFSAEGRGVPELLGRPLLIRVVGRRLVHHPLAVDVHDEESEDGSEPDVVGLDEIARPNGVVAQKGPPTLSAMRCSRPDASHVLVDRAL
jgi:hypothetical protein